MGFRETMEGTVQDARYALRGLRREPLFTGFAVATLALGIGANAAVYGVVDRLLIRGPEHVTGPDGMVRLTTTVTEDGIGEVTFGSYGYVMYTTLRDHATAFGGVAAYADGNTLLGQGRGAQAIHAGFATADFFPLLGVRPQLGRFYQPDEDDPAGASKVIVLGDALWRTRFGADPSIVGTEVDLSDGKYTVIGVAPKGFTGVELERIDAWLPMTLYSQDVTRNWQTAWNAQWLRIVARLKDGVTRAAAGAEATRALRGAYDGSPTGTFSEARLNTVPLHYTTGGREANEAAVSRWLLGVTAVVLLIACTNVSNLLLARAVRRRGEVGVRLALGAARARLARLFFTESLVLALLGGAMALLVAGALSVTIRQSLLSNIEWTSAPVSGRVILVSLVVSLFVGLLVGLAPSIHAARGSLMSAIQRGHASGRRIGLGAWPTALQACLTATLLIGAGVFSLSFYRARHVPLGFESERVLVAQAQFAPIGDVDSVARVAALARRNEVWRRGLERVRSMPGTERAALAAGLPFGSTFKIPLFVPGWDSIPKIPGGGPYVAAVTGDYFATVGTRLLRGREFTETEREGTDRVAVVNQTMANTLWPNADAIGQCVHMWERTSPCSQVVGVVEDARRYELREEPTMQYYIPLGQNQGFGGTVLMVRPRSTPAEAAPAIASMLEGLDATTERAVARPMRAAIDPLLRPWRLGATIFGLGGVLALLVAALGLYSVMSYSVTQRSHELGVRIALGATSRAIVGLVMRQSLVIAAAGLAGGILIALYAGRRVEGLLFETSVGEPLVLGSTVGVLIVTAILASLIPALRARSVDPMRALRSD
jgi:predicted permease